jgi:hypothetical protein
VFEIIDPNQPEVFQTIFGMVMTVLIALVLWTATSSTNGLRPTVTGPRTEALPCSIPNGRNGCCRTCV